MPPAKYQEDDMISISSSCSEEWVSLSDTDSIAANNREDQSEVDGFVSVGTALPLEKIEPGNNDNHNTHTKTDHTETGSTASELPTEPIVHHNQLRARSNQGHKWRGPLALMELIDLHHRCDYDTIQASIQGRSGHVVNEFTPAWIAEHRAKTARDARKEAALITKTAESDDRVRVWLGCFDTYCKESKKQGVFKDEKTQHQRFDYYRGMLEVATRTKHFIESSVEKAIHSGCSA